MYTPATGGNRRKLKLRQRSLTRRPQRSPGNQHIQRCVFDRETRRILTAQHRLTYPVLQGMEVLRVGQCDVVYRD